MKFLQVREYEFSRMLVLAVGIHGVALAMLSLTLMPSSRAPLPVAQALRFELVEAARPAVAPPPVLVQQTMPVAVTAPVVARNIQKSVPEKRTMPTLPVAQLSRSQPALTPLPETALQAARARYEQEISAAIQRYNYYPSGAEGREGRVVIRLRIDRHGNVQYYAVENSSGVYALDAAALAMVRRAHPLPAVPAGYPEGNMIEFLIPITFRVPQ